METIKEKDAIIRLLKALFPDVTIYLFGSRARGTARVTSDIDLALDAGKRLSSLEIEKAKNVLSALNIPQKIDIVDLHSVPQNMKDIILKEGITLGLKKSFFILLIVWGIFSLQAITPEEILQNLTLDQKLGQLFIASAISDVERNKAFIEKKGYRLDPEYILELIKNYHIGGVIFLGRGEPISQVKITQQFQQASEIPLLMCQDLECGLSMRLDDTIVFPKNGTLGSIKNNVLLYQLGFEIGRQCTEIGIHMNFAPVVDVNNNPNNPVIGPRSFGDDKENVTQKALAFSRGLHDAGVLSCIKHFPGHGDTDIDSHYALPCIKHNKERLHDIELYPFKHLIKAGIPAIMIAHLEVPALEKQSKIPTTLSYAVVTELLQDELGFEGLIITDALDMKALSGKPEEIALQAFSAGNDVLLCCSDIPAAIENIKNQIESGLISEQELDRRVLKNLKWKQWVFARQKKLTTENLFEQLHTKNAYDLQKCFL